MRLLVSCIDNGSLKEIVCNQNTDTSVQTGLQPLHVEMHLAQGLGSYVEKMCLVSPKIILLARANGAIELVQIETVAKYNDEDKKNSSLPLPEFEVSSFEVVDKLDGFTDNSRIEHLFKNSKKRTRVNDGFVTLSPMPHSVDTFFVATKSGLIHVIKVDEKTNKLSKVSSLEVKAPLEFAQLYDLDINSDRIVFGYGGEENIVKLVELEKDFSSLKEIWEAKNVKNDRLDMRVPVWPVGLKFLLPYNGKDKDSTKLNYQFIIITRYSHLGKYRTQHGRKPMEYIDLLPNREPLTSLKLIYENVTEQGNAETEDFNDIEVVTTDTKKDVMKFDHSGRLLCKFGKQDIVGASKFIDVDDQKYLLQGGFDRYLRIFDLQSNKRTVKIYVGSKIQSVLVLDDEEVEIPDDPNSPEYAKKMRKLKREQQTKEDNEEELWDSLDKRSKKQKK
ncbi:hypothetical protein TPHA_0N01160 [Tetrapisispora phaffii CBS 4417]|uniref:Ribosome biogenesis protein NSA1 n=1 Tax=Tetrapisispora phaffii (strain ATCC 24235 / CBS 4417 / NBRC 1672 / NRRL Y-8282 / UCD 70-5) TaxID=1071381 RepID=G8C169_TETPH|nr:hypothetical protein TPHA_0N01160 [Tetrapisispora phaffii CBS 4417]CCE65897.1 hypothetical protein TPHA_0N01160 [Tetrapisispora phaffii CBS 4417]